MVAYKDQGWCSCGRYIVMHVNVLIFFKVMILAYSMTGTVFTGNFFKSMIKIVLVISAGFQVFCRYQLILI